MQLSPYSLPQSFDFAALGALKCKRHAIVSIWTAPVILFCSSPHYYESELLKLNRRSAWSCFCSPNDAEYVEAKFGVSGENSEPLTFLDPNLEQEESSIGDANSKSDPELVSQSCEEDGIRIQIVQLGKRSRRIESSILTKASLPTIWTVLTDYEKLADFIPGLAVCRLLDKGDKYARLFQIGQQDLALGLKFYAKAVLDCYEKDLEILSYGQRRSIEFKMVEGDFEIFEGRWSIFQYDAETREVCQGFQTTLFYEVELVPKLWLPVRLVEGRICKEIKTNLSCIRQEAQMRPPSTGSWS